MPPKAGFQTPLRFEKVGPRRWLLIDDLTYASAILSGEFTVSRGFQTDLASIPRLLWVIAPKVDVYDAAAVLHDAAYAHAVLNGSGSRVYLTKQWADQLFYEAMRALGVSRFRASLMYAAVQQFGSPEDHPLASHRLTVSATVGKETLP